MATPDRPQIKDRPDRLEIGGPGARAAASPAAAAPGRSGPAGALRWGLAAAWTCKRLVLFVLAVNLCAAVITAYPLLGPMAAPPPGIGTAQEPARGFDAAWWADLRFREPVLITRTVSMMGLAGIVTVFLGAFFAGGLLEALKHGRSQPMGFEPLPDPSYGGAIPQWRAAAPGPATIRVFLKESARHFPRLVVLLLLSLPAYAAVEWLFNGLAGRLASRWLEAVEDERAGLLIGLVKSGLFVLAFHAVTVVFEYARAHEILKPGATLLSLLSLPFELLLRRPAALLGIEAGAVVLQATALLAFIPIQGLLDRWPAVAATAGFGAMQLFVFARLFIRAGAQGAQIRLAEEYLRTAR